MSYIDPWNSTPSSRGTPRRRWAVLRLAQAVPALLRTQAFRRFVLAIPALAIMFCVLAALPALRSDPSQIRSRYERLAMTALAEDDKATAAVCLDRLTRLKHQSKIKDPEFAFRLSTLAGELGQAERAEVQLSEAAPEDRPLYAPAHQARALSLLRGRPDVSRDDVIRAERHYRYALQLQPDLAAAHEGLGMLALQAGDWSRAKTHLERASRANPTLTYLVAVILSQQGLSEPATTWARAARDHFRRLVEKDPDAHAARVIWAASELLLEEFETTRTVLRQGLARANLVEFHQLMANAYLAEAATLRLSNEANLGNRLALLEQGLRHDPGNSALITLTSEILKGGSLEAEQLRTKLRELLTEGKAVATGHLLLGFDAWERGRPDEARLHWERAHSAAPGSTMVANNLAWVLSTGPEPDLPRALSLIELALDAAPDEPTFLSTQGRILARMGRWKDALAALEVALPAKADSPDLHHDLAEVYDALKAPELAQEHRRRAEELRGGSTPPGR